MKNILTILIFIFYTMAGYANEALQGALFSSAQKISAVQKIAAHHIEQNTGLEGMSLTDTQKLKTEINKVLKKRFPDAEILSFSQIPKNGTIIYDCDVSYRGSVIKLYINPQNGAISGKLDDKDLLDEKITKSVINNSTKEVNNVLKQIKLDASFSDVKYNKKDKTLEGNILYMDIRYYFKMNAGTGEIIEMRALD